MPLSRYAHSNFQITKLQDSRTAQPLLTYNFITSHYYDFTMVVNSDFSILSYMYVCMYVFY